MKKNIEIKSVIFSTNWCVLKLLYKMHTKYVIRVFVFINWTLKILFKLCMSLEYSRICSKSKNTKENVTELWASQQHKFCVVYKSDKLDWLNIYDPVGITKLFPSLIFGTYNTKRESHGFFFFSSAIFIPSFFFPHWFQ